jgi:hypothetical protein
MERRLAASRWCWLIGAVVLVSPVTPSAAVSRPLPTAVQELQTALQELQAQLTAAGDGGRRGDEPLGRSRELRRLTTQLSRRQDLPSREELRQTLQRWQTERTILVEQPTTQICIGRGFVYSSARIARPPAAKVEPPPQVQRVLRCLSELDPPPSNSTP